MPDVVWAKTRRAHLCTSGVFVLTILAIVALHLLEVVVWAMFFVYTPFADKDFRG